MTKTAHYPESTVSPDLPQLEEAVLKRWDENRVFEQSVEQRPPEKEWVFYDGPPFANGLPHYGHLLTSYVKDIFARYHTMKGERVERRFGWDCHGLPAEMAAEKELDVSGRAAIEQYGITKFNDYCRSSVMRYTNEWQNYINRAGRWVDFEHDYKTMDQDYMESVLWAFKELHKKGLIYESFRVMPYSWAAETPLSNFETKMDDAYRERTDKAITVAFTLKEPPQMIRDFYEHTGIEVSSYKVLAWTTTPWTLPSNLALAVSPNLTYRAYLQDGEVHIMAGFACSQFGDCANADAIPADGWEGEFEQEQLGLTFTGDALVGAEYEPLFPYFAHLADEKEAQTEGLREPSASEASPNAEASRPEQGQSKGAFRVLDGSSFIEQGSGTGIVHLAPGFGEDDMRVCMENGIDIVCPVDESGCYTDEIFDLGTDVPPTVYGGRLGGGQFSTRKEDAIIKAKDLRKNMTEAEKTLWQMLRGKQLEACKFRKQVPIGPYIVDFACLQKGLIIELDGGQHAGNANYDRERDAFLQEAGYTVLRFWNNELTENQEAVYDKILAELERLPDQFVANSAPLLTSPRKQGEEQKDTSPREQGEEKEDASPLFTGGIEGEQLPPLSLKGLNVIAETEGKHADEPYSDEQLQKYGLANLRIINWLKQTGQLIKQEDYKHSYPHCWRTDTPIIYRALSSWYVEVTQFKDRMVELNQQINWIPEHVKDGQFGKWLENARDWSISRNRFWGCPIPVWRGDKGGIKVFGSKQELEAFFETTVEDLHRPYIDELTITKDGESWTRVSDVFDCWFESGSMPFAQVHYPFEPASKFSPSSRGELEGGNLSNSPHPNPPPQAGEGIRGNDWFENHFPADFITEYIGQTRGWFYTLVVLGTALFDRIPFKNVICHGVILAEDGKKLSKRLKNYPDPNAMFDAYGADAVRFRMIKEPIMHGGNLLISKDGSCIRDVVRLSLKPFWNAYHFFTLYANADGIRAHDLLELEAAEDDASTGGPCCGGAHAPGEHPLSTHDLDRYILAKLKESVKTIERALDQFDTPAACKAFDGFFEVLNNWYIRRNRDRFWAPMGDEKKRNEGSMSESFSGEASGSSRSIVMRSGSNLALIEDKQAAYDTLYTCLITMAKAAAPLLPMMSEHIYSALTEGKSPHLQDFPDVSAIGKETALLTAMDRVRQVCATALALREQENIRIRQPLSSLTVYAPDADSLNPFTAIIEDELNVKQVKLEKDLKQVAERKLKINFPVVGKRLGPKMKAITQAANQGEWHYLPTVYEQRLKTAQSDLPERDDTAFRPAISDPPDPAQLEEPTGEAIEIAGETLQEGEFSILLESKLAKGAQALPTQDALVALDLELTDALLQEGIARDVIRMIQNARKAADLNITDRIALTIHATDTAHEQAIRAHEATIREQTLAESLHYGDQPAEHESQETLEGAPLTIRFSVKRKQAA